MLIHQAIQHIAGEFLELFLPQVARAIDRDSVGFLPQEYFADLTTGETKIIDLLAEVQIAGQDAGFLVHVENQSSTESDFSRRRQAIVPRLKRSVCGCWRRSGLTLPELA